MNNRIDAIYARQSVDKKDSISIESQIEFCKYELKGGNCKEYKDKGYSGKNTERPQFQQLMRDIESGLVRKVVVYKLDRISRSILDFAKMMDFFQKYEVEFVSSTEKFDTSTPMGRAMLNICIVFAQLERETIQKRVQDAWYSRCQRGFKMGGKTPYGFRTEPYVMDGVRTKKLVIEPTEAAFVRQMYEMYADPQVSLHDITKKLTADGMRTYHGRPLSRAKEVHIRNDEESLDALFAPCKLAAKRFVNPIVDWSNRGVWDFLHDARIPVNPLYFCDFSRVGCIGCPMAGKHRYFEFARYPQYEKLYLMAFDRMLEERRRRGKLDGSWHMGTTAEDVFHWWMEDDFIRGQMSLEEFLYVC